MPIDPDRLCRCHGEPMQRSKDQHYCAVKVRQTWQRASRKYRATAKGDANDQRNRARRIFIGNKYHSRAETVEQAVAINRHIKGRSFEFKSRLTTGAEAESDSESAVCPEATA